MPDVALSAPQRRPRLSLKTPLSKPVTMPKQQVRVVKADPVSAQKAGPVALPAGGTASDIGDLSKRTGDAVTILQAAREGVAHLQKWVSVARSLANLMREAANAFNASNQAEVATAAEQAARTLLASLITQYNNVLTQIDITARDATFAGVNLLNGDVVTFAIDETRTSALSMSGAVCDAAGLGLAPLLSDIDVAASTGTVLAALQAAGAKLRKLAQTIASNLATVENRGQFHANLSGVLEAGPGLVSATPSEEAANSFALSRHQAIATSARALARESETSILRLLNRTRVFGQDG